MKVVGKDHLFKKHGCKDRKGKQDLPKARGVVGFFSYGRYEELKMKPKDKKAVKKEGFSH